MSHVALAAGRGTGQRRWPLFHAGALLFRGCPSPARPETVSTWGTRASWWLGQAKAPSGAARRHRRSPGIGLRAAPSRQCRRLHGRTGLWRRLFIAKLSKMPPPPRRRAAVLRRCPPPSSFPLLAQRRRRSVPRAATSAPKQQALPAVPPRPARGPALRAQRRVRGHNSRGVAALALVRHCPHAVSLQRE